MYVSDSPISRLLESDDNKCFGSLRSKTYEDMQNELCELYLNSETVWNIIRTSFSIADDSMLSHIENALPIASDQVNGVLTHCTKCGKQTRLGASYFRNTCRYCGSKLYYPTDSNTSELRPLFVVPNAGNPDLVTVENVKSSIYSSMFFPYYLSVDNRINDYNFALQQEVAALLYKCQAFDRSYKQIYIILFVLCEIVHEQLQITSGDFINALLSFPSDIYKEKSILHYPNILLSIIWRFVAKRKNLTNDTFDLEKKQLSVTNEGRAINQQPVKIHCKVCLKDVLPRTGLICQCPYCGGKLRETEIDDIFLMHI